MPVDLLERPLWRLTKSFSVFGSRRPCDEMQSLIPELRRVEMLKMFFVMPEHDC